MGEIIAPEVFVEAYRRKWNEDPHPQVERVHEIVGGLHLTPQKLRHFLQTGELDPQVDAFFKQGEAVRYLPGEESILWIDMMQISKRRAPETIFDEKGNYGIAFPILGRLLASGSHIPQVTAISFTAHETIESLDIRYVEGGVNTDTSPVVLPRRIGPSAPIFRRRK